MHGRTDTVAATFTADRSLAFCQNGELWDVATLTRLAPDRSNQRVFRSGIHQAAFSANGNLLAIATGFALEIWDVKRLVRVHSVGFTKASRRMDPASVAFAPDGRVVAVGDKQGKVGLWDALTGEDLGEIAESTARDDSHSAGLRSRRQNPDLRNGGHAARDDDGAQRCGRIALRGTGLLRVAQRCWSRTRQQHQ